MLALRIDLLTGRYVATAYGDRSEAEWPIHPARVFSAFVAAHHSSSPPDPEERAALEWLEALPAPMLHMPEAQRRETTTVYVPVNDPTLISGAEAAAEKLLATREDPMLVDRGPRKSSSAVSRTGAALDRAIAKAEATLRTALEDARDSTETRKTALSILPAGRNRQPRMFPLVVPEEPSAFLFWPAAAPQPEVARALVRLAARVTRIGHSSSLVFCRFVEDPPEATWVPADSDEGSGRREVVRLRVVGKGQLRALEDEHARHGGVAPRSLPCRMRTYVRQAIGTAFTPAEGVFTGGWMVFQRVLGPRFPSGSAVDVAAAFRDALMSHAEQPVREVLSGHAIDSAPSCCPHVAIVPLPYVGGEHADGALLGLALLLPRTASPEDRRHVLGAVGRWEKAARSDGGGGEREEGAEPPGLRLTMGRAGVLVLRRVLPGARAALTLQAASWCKPSRAWATATPVALDRFPGDLFSSDTSKADAAAGKAAESIARACEHVGLPRPVSVFVDAAPILRGAAAASRYGPFPRERGRVRRLLVHAVVRFDREVRGPVLLGAGRYFGLGLCRPQAATEGEWNR